jgi:GNAT superfamily N-acetyltransferase
VILLVPASIAMTSKPAESTLLIRFATPDDTTAIASVLYDVFKEFKPLYTSGGFTATTPTSDIIRSRFDESPIWVAVQDTEIVGTVTALPKGDELYVRSMGVVPSARGHKIGELLLERVETFALEHGFTTLYLSTTPFLTRAIRLYEHWGFRRTDRGPHDLFGTPLFTMTKSLASSD